MSEEEANRGTAEVAREILAETAGRGVGGRGTRPFGDGRTAAGGERRVLSGGKACGATGVWEHRAREGNNARRVGRTLVAGPAGRCAIRPANSEEESGFHCGRDPHSCAGNRSEHGAIFRSRWSAAEPTALSAFRTTCHAA